MRLLPLVIGLTASLALASCVVASGAGGPDDNDGGALDGARDGRPGDAPAADAPAGDAPQGDAPAPADGAQADGAQVDAGPADGARADGAQTDGAQTDGAQTDGAQTDGAQTDGAQTDGAQQDATQQDGSAACTQVPALAGVYSYSNIPLNTLPDLGNNPPVNFPAVAWHPSGTYALALAYTGRVIRFTSSTGAVDQVANLGTGTYWKHASFTPDGSKAVLLAWDSGASEGRIYLWDHAGGTVAEMSPAQRAPGIYYESLAWSPGGQARLLGRNNNSSNWIVYLWPFDATSGRDTAHAYARNTGAGCQDLAFATDQYDATAVAVVCGINSGDVFHVDSGGQYQAGPGVGSIGNTSRIAGRPQGDYAVAVCWSCNSKLYRFKQGLWNVPYASPLALGAYPIGFSTDGRRALALGGYQSGSGQVYEYVHDAYPTWNDTNVPLMNVSIANFGSPPYNAGSNVELNDVAWRPGCDQGLLVGGSSTQGYIIKFTVDNGCACPD